MTLADFLLTRIAEDEAMARAAHVTTALPPIWDTGMFYGPCAPASAHIARWDPARALAECEAKRCVVEAFAPVVRDGGDGEFRLEQVFKMLALPYASHPDYCEEWRT